MVRNSRLDNKLESQLRESFGKVTYTHKAHEKCADALDRKRRMIKSIQIALSTITTGGLLYTIFGDNSYVLILGTIASGLLLALTLYYKEFKIEEEIEKYKATALKLWNIRELYISLLTDFYSIDREEITRRRDDLQRQLFEIYKQAPRTNTTGYLTAQKALKQKEELTFTDEEIDCMLPIELRTKKSEEYL